MGSALWGMGMGMETSSVGWGGVGMSFAEIGWDGEDVCGDGWERVRNLIPVENSN